MGLGQIFGTNITENHLGTLFALFFAAWDENVQFLPQNSDIWGQKSFFVLGSRFFVRKYHQYTQGYNFPIGTTQPKFSVSERWVIFWDSPRFLAIFGSAQ